MDLKDKVVLVTGSSLGIQRETAILFAQRGAKVVVTYYKDKKDGGKVFSECKKYGDALLIQLDVSNDESINEAVSEIIKRFKGIDILVNNAGVVVWKTLEKHSKEEIHDQIETNLLGVIAMTHACLPYLEEWGGVIVNVSSGAGKTGYGGLSVYCATKFGVRGFTQALAQELKKSKVYCVNPGSTATRMTGFRGVSPRKVGEIILQAVEEKLGKRSGDDIDVWEYV